MSRNPKKVFLCQLSFSAHDDFLTILESIIEIDVDRDSDSIPDRSTSDSGTQAVLVDFTY